jgi:hypothetical protein
MHFFPIWHFQGQKPFWDEPLANLVKGSKARISLHPADSQGEINSEFVSHFPARFAILNMHRQLSQARASVPRFFIVREHNP